MNPPEAAAPLVPFHERLTLEIRQRGLIQAELVRRSGLDASEISRLVRGRRGPSGRQLEAIAAALKVLVADLVAGTTAAVIFDAVLDEEADVAHVGGPEARHVDDRPDAGPRHERLDPHSAPEPGGEGPVADGSVDARVHLGGILKGAALERRRRISSIGGKAAHENGTAHEFTPEEAREAGKKGGMAVSQDRDRMAAIGTRGRQEAGARRWRPRRAMWVGEGR
jgi:transcriptional regulator with XRE-family HTH domain